MSLAFEPFLDRTGDEAARQSGYLAKATLAPQISQSNLFMSRPVIRVFFTYAHWSEAYMGQIGGLDFAHRNQGYTAGVQMETWW
jgi:maltoporin